MAGLGEESKKSGSQYIYIYVYIYISYIYICTYIYIYMGVVQNTFSRTALNRSANRVATAAPQ